MAKIDKLLKLIQEKNLAVDLSEEERTEIARDVITGCRVDEKTKETWLKVNQEAMKIIKHCEEESTTEGLFDGNFKLIYPLLAPAIIQLASRMSTITVRNGRTVECEILGPDIQIPNPQDLQQIKELISSPQFQQQAAQALQQGQQPPAPPQPRMMWVKKDKSTRVSNYMNYELLVKSNKWLAEDHKLDAIVASWGVGFKRTYYNFITKEVGSDLINPENIIINHNISCLNDAPRITEIHYLTENQIIEYIRAGYFLDVDLDTLSPVDSSDKNIRSDNEDEDPIYKFYCQYTNIDLDEDGYAEPYKVYVHDSNETLFSIEPAFEAKDIEVVLDKDSAHYGEVQTIKRRLEIIDRHCIDSPDGCYWSLGLNYLLLHSNKAITSVLRQLLDAGALKNAAAVSGFITKAFKTRERDVSFSFGKFDVVDVDPGVNPQEQIIKMPMDEPSQVLLQLLELLIETSKNSGFINDILTGNVEMQNVPATTALATIEQATRAFKPIISNKLMSMQEEFKALYHLYGKYMDQPKYAKFQGQVLAVTKDDFNEDSTDISPVADPTMSSEAHKYAKCRALLEGIQAFGSVTNMQEAATRYYTDMEFDAPEKLLQQQQSPDPKLMEVQLKQQIAAQNHQIDMILAQLKSLEVQNSTRKVDLETYKTQVHANVEGAKVAKIHADAVRDKAQTHLDEVHAEVALRNSDIESRKVDVMAKDVQNNAENTGGSE